MRQNVLKTRQFLVFKTKLGASAVISSAELKTVISEQIGPAHFEAKGRKQGIERSVHHVLVLLSIIQC